MRRDMRFYCAVPKFLLLFLLLGLAAPTAAQIDPKLTAQCNDARDFVGCVKAYTTIISRPENTKSKQEQLDPSLLVNLCYGLRTENEIRDCTSKNKMVPLPTRPRMLGGSGPKKPYLQMFRESITQITFIAFPDPISSSKQGVAYEADCLTRILKVVEDDGKRSLIGHFAAGSVADFACTLRSNSTSKFHP